MDYLNTITDGGFNFDQCHRNNFLTDNKLAPGLRFTKTGTTIVGVCFKDGVALAADTRATAGSTVAEKNCQKLHCLAPNMYAAGAGTAADLEHVKHKMAAELELMRLNSGRQSRISTVATRLSWDLFRYQGNIGAYLIVGGVDVKGPQIVQISAHGNYSYLPFAAMGSGSMAAVSILEAKYHDDMTREDAQALVIEAIEAGIFNDLGSGSNVDVAIIQKDKPSEYLRNIRVYNKKKVQKPTPYDFPIGNTPVLKELNFKIETTSTEEFPVHGEGKMKMDVEGQKAAKKPGMEIESEKK